MKTLFCLISLLLAFPVVAEEKAAPWPPQGYAHVVGFCYDYGKDPRGDSLVFPDGTLHRGIIKATTVRFSKEQSDRLVKMLTTEPTGEEGEEDCYEPHHGFVFYDREWKVVGWFEVCFSCSGSVASSEEAPLVVDFGALEAFAREAGLPVLEDDAAYSKLYERENPPPAADGKKAGAPGVRTEPAGEKTPARQKKALTPEEEDPFAPE